MRHTGPSGRSKPANTTLTAVAVALVSFFVTFAVMTWSDGGWRGLSIGALQHDTGTRQNRVVIIRPDRRPPSPAIEVIDGDTVRLDGVIYRLVGFDTPERGDRARCNDERRRAEAATARLTSLVTSSDASLKRVSCACPAGTEGTSGCNFGRLCGSLTVGGRDVSQILISEGHARPLVCVGTSCSPRRSWC